MAGSSGFVDPSGSGRQWYDLFSRGARDWLRLDDRREDDPHAWIVLAATSR